MTKQIFECDGTGYEDCTEIASWAFHGQFFGTVHLCEKHAKQDKCFGDNENSHYFWEKL